MASALAFFSANEVPTTETFSVEITAKLPVEAGATAAGCCVEKRKTICVVPFSKFRKNKTWFGASVDEAMYQALATQEAAHAAASCNVSIPNPTIQAKEYLACIAMFSSMPTALRQKALAGAPAERFDSFDRFTPMPYMFDPMRLGAGAYRHFSALPDPAFVIRAVLTPRALTDWAVHHRFASRRTGSLLAWTACWVAKNCSRLFVLNARTGHLRRKQRMPIRSEWPSPKAPQ